MSQVTPAPRLLVVGTVPLDSGGAVELARLLETVQPGCVTVEVSRWDLLWRARRAPALLARLGELVEGQGRTAGDALQALRIQLAEPFTHRAAREWSSSTGRGVAVVPVDSSRNALPRLAELEQQLSGDELTAVVEDEEFRLSRAVIEQQLLARRYRWDSHLFSWHFSRRELVELAAGAEAMARVILGHLARIAPAPLVHLGGWHQLVPGGEGGLRTLATVLDERGVAWQGLLLGDRLPPPWAPVEAEPEAQDEDAHDTNQEGADDDTGSTGPAEPPDATADEPTRKGA